MIWVHDWCPTWLADGKRCRATSSAPFVCELCKLPALPGGDNPANPQCDRRVFDEADLIRRGVQR